MDYSGKSVALIDDDKINIAVTRKFLSRFNITPDIGYSAAELFEKLKTNKFDLILLDNMMPNMEGIEAIRILKGKVQNDIYDGTPYSNPVVVLTGDSKLPQEFLSAGFDDYLAKPISATELDRILRKYLGN